MATADHRYAITEKAIAAPTVVTPPTSITTTVSATAATTVVVRGRVDGTVQVQFHDDHGETISTVVVSAELLRHLPMVAEVTLAVLGVGGVVGPGQHGGQLGRI